MDYSAFIEVQNHLKKRVVIKPYSGRIKLFCGVDVAFDLKSKRSYAAMCVLNQSLKLIEVVVGESDIVIPYIPNLLSFREFPPAYKAFRQLKNRPDVFIFDAQGIAHRRHFGFASHFGVSLSVPTIGCAKSKLIGMFKEPDKKKGSLSLLYDGNDIIGCVLRTKDNVKPVFVSVGHLINLSDSVRIIMDCTNGFRLPEPTRLAHIYANKVKLGEI